MPADLLPPPEARLIRRLREAPPKMSKRQAAERAGMSESRWRQIENGYKHFRGVRYEETGPPQTIARMTEAVGGTPEQLTEVGAVEAAAELAAMLLAHPVLGERQRRRLQKEARDLGEEDIA